MKKRSLLLVSLLISAQASAERFDGAKLDSAKAPEAPKASVKPVDVKSAKRSRALIPDIGKERAEDLRKAIGSFSIILARTRPGPVANKLILSRAKSYLSLAQLALYSQKPGAVIPPQATTYLRAASTDAEAVLRMPQLDVRSRAEALYVLGLGAVYANNTPRAMEFFRNSLQVNPNSKESTWMAFYLAEEYFEANQINEAIIHYRKCVTKGERRIRSTAGYKLAWAYLNAGNEAMAASFFTWIPKAFPGTDIARDSIRDLAFVTVKSKNEETAVELADKYFTDPRLVLDFLRAIHGNLEVQGKVSRNSPVFRRLMQLEKDPVRRVQLQLSVLAMNRREFASERHFAEFLTVRNAIEAEKLRPKSKEIEPLNAVWDAENQKIIRSFIETFAGRVKSPENISRERMGEVLKQLFPIYLFYFPESPIKPTLYSLWMDVCSDLKDWESLNRVALIVATDPQLEALRPRAELDRINALEELFKKDKKWTNELLEALQATTKAQKVEAKAWLRIAKRLAELYVDRKEYDDAIPLLELILEKDLSSDSHYRLQWARFLDERYDDVLKFQEPPKGVKSDPRAIDIVRESALKLAVNARAKADAEDYAKYLSVFIGINTDPAKSVVARRDYLSFLLELEAYPQAVKTLLAIPAVKREPDFSDFLLTLAHYSLRQGEFQTVLDLIPRAAPQGASERNPELVYARELARLALKGEPNLALLHNLPKPKQQYLVSLLSLVQPQIALRFFNQSPPVSENDRVMALTAFRMDLGKWDFVPGKKHRIWLGDMAPKVPPPDVFEVRFERQIAKLPFPDPAKKGKNAEAEFTKKLQALIEGTRTARSFLQADLKGISVSSQVRVLTTARNHEEKVSAAILNSPAPAGLAEAQLAEYRTGLGELAKEFVDQAAEIGKLVTSASTILKTEQETRETALIPLPSFDQWSWPGSDSKPPMSIIIEFLKQGNPLGAMILADLLREDKLKDNDDYYGVRAGILLLGRPSEAMQRYVWEELNQSKAQDVIDEWRGAVK